MIIGVHALIYTRKAEALRAFLRDKLGWPSVDAHDGWLIFKLPPAELAAHPTDEAVERHELWLMCDDIEATMEELKGKGVEFTGPATEQGFGLVTGMLVPGGRIGLYQPKHPTAI